MADAGASGVDRSELNAHNGVFGIGEIASRGCCGPLKYFGLLPRRKIPRSPGIGSFTSTMQMTRPRRAR